jgi:hypothetical protein
MNTIEIPEPPFDVEMGTKIIYKGRVYTDENTDPLIKILLWKSQKMAEEKAKNEKRYWLMAACTTVMCVITLFNLA